MSSNQSMLVIGSIFLLGMLIVNFYNSNTEQLVTSVENETILAATGIAQSLLDDIQNRAFDEYTVDKYTDTPDSLTSAYMLGPEGGETSSILFDDIDDFDGFNSVDSSTRLGAYNISVDVFYVANFLPDSTTSSPTFLKRINVNVINAYMEDTLTLSHLIGY